MQHIHRDLTPMSRRHNIVRLLSMGVTRLAACSFANCTSGPKRAPSRKSMIQVCISLHFDHDIKR
jgi:hypothetical protein